MASVHFNRDDRPVCGSRAYQPVLTDERKSVTCKKCIRCIDGIFDNKNANSQERVDKRLTEGKAALAGLAGKMRKPIFTYRCPVCGARCPRFVAAGCPSCKQSKPR